MLGRLGLLQDGFAYEIGLVPVERVGTTYIETPSGGAAGDGSALISYVAEPIATGGASATGDALVAAVYAPALTGGASGAGTASPVYTAAPEPVGSAQGDGAASVSAIYVAASLGGVASDGEALTSAIYAPLAAGTIVLGGSAPVAEPYLPSGGAVLGGTALPVSLYVYEPSGGVVLGRFDRSTTLIYGPFVEEAGQYIVRSRPSYWEDVRRPATEMKPYPWKRMEEHKWTTIQFRAYVLGWLVLWLSSRTWITKWSIEELAYVPRSPSRLRRPRLVLRVTRGSDRRVFETTAEFDQDDVVLLDFDGVIAVMDAAGALIDAQAA